MAVVCSGFSYAMEVVSHGFVTDISKTTLRMRRGSMPCERASRPLVISVINDNVDYYD